MVLVVEWLQNSWVSLFLVNYYMHIYFYFKSGFHRVELWSLSELWSHSIALVKLLPHSLIETLSSNLQISPWNPWNNPYFPWIVAQIRGFLGLLISYFSAHQFADPPLSCNHTYLTGRYERIQHVTIHLPSHWCTELWTTLTSEGET